MSSEMLIKTIRPENRPWAKERKKSSARGLVWWREEGRKNSVKKKEQSLV